MGKICTFFGHRDCPDSVKPKLREVLTDLIEHHGVDRFYVGRQGAFDALARAVLQELSKTHPHISYAVVLERLPGRRDDPDPDFSHSIFPEGLETVPPRFAIARRNDWMLRQADCVVAYVIHAQGGAATFTAKARRQQKTVLNLGRPADPAGRPPHK